MHGSFLWDIKTGEVEMKLGLPAVLGCNAE
jgi:hypothetical protein